MDTTLLAVDATQPRWTSETQVMGTVHTGTPVRDPSPGPSPVRLSMVGHMPCSQNTHLLRPPFLVLDNIRVPPQGLSSIWTCRRLFI
jgi:hypothetical protein